LVKHQENIERVAMPLESPSQREFVHSNSQQLLSPEVEQNSMSLLSILLVLKSGKRIIFIATGVLFVVSVVIAIVLPPQYTSAAAVIPPPSSSNSSAALVGQLSALGAGGILGGAAAKSPADLYIGVLKSRSVAEEMVKRFDLKTVYKLKKETSAEKILASKSEFEVDTKTSIIKISVVDGSPSRARDMTQAYLDVLRSTNDRLAIGESSQRRLFFEQRLVKEKDDLENAEVELKKTEENSGLIAPSGQTASEIQTIAATRAQITAREVELAGQRHFLSEESPDVIRLKSEVSNLQEQLAHLQEGKEKGHSGSIPTSMVPQLQLDYVRKEREVKYHESLFEIIARQYEAARLDEAHNAPLLQVLDNPSSPDQKSSPHRTLIVLGGAIFGTFIGCLWVLINDYIQALRKSRLTL
jgi:tyrosine-protein kinase Etk/Wzc